MRRVLLTFSLPFEGQKRRSKTKKNKRINVGINTPTLRYLQNGFFGATVTARISFFQLPNLFTVYGVQT
jgi:hypothetical protein